MKSLYERLLDTEDNLVSGMNDIDLVRKQLETIYDLSRITDIKVKSDGIYIYGNIWCNSHSVDTLILPGINIKYISGYFICSSTQITSLKGAPEEVGEEFTCPMCPNLISLEGAPKKVGGDFNCFNCDNLKTLEGAPKEIKKNFDCSGCPSLISLEGAPEKVGGKFICEHCRQLRSMQGLPKVIKKGLYCGGSELPFMEIPKNIDIYFIGGRSKRMKWNRN